MTLEVATVHIELLYFQGCPHAQAFVPRLRELVADAGINEAVRLRRVESVQEAERERFLGSPTLRVNGRDVDPGAAEREDFGLRCRIYLSASGIAGTPPEEWVRRALRSAMEDPTRMAEARLDVPSAISASWASSNRAHQPQGASVRAEHRLKQHR